jgi:hypothetical protein
MKFLPLIIAILIPACGLSPAHIQGQLSRMSDADLRRENIIIESRPELWAGPRRGLVIDEMEKRGMD